ncbi:hypothetical protein EWM64_g1663 [Hericium alpestre]|uniref:D-lactate dehydratase n=1 Tax=Hericium alpestre TaxID=135208 RepID=A0A4Z0A5R3_9AGAM|nr:hypothetical protein EWM64_g1663 [Hericium alpestre]
MDLKGGATGWYLPEAAHPYYVLAPHFQIEFASPLGPNPPVDPTSVEQFKDDESVGFLQDGKVRTLLANAKPLSTVNADDYTAIFYVGGHGPVIDLPFDDDNLQVANKFYRSGKVVAAVCHGPAALVNVTGADGKSIFDGKTATAFSLVEEQEVGKVESVPFQIEERIKERGGKYVKAAEHWGVKICHDGTLLTGQNPASAKPLGEELLKTLKK